MFEFIVGDKAREDHKKIVKLHFPQMEESSTSVSRINYHLGELQSMHQILFQKTMDESKQWVETSESDWSFFDHVMEFLDKLKSEFSVNS